MMDARNSHSQVGSQVDWRNWLRPPALPVRRSMVMVKPAISSRLPTARSMSIAKARTLLVSKNKSLALQGNFDPIALFAKPEQITQEAIGILDSLAKAPALKSRLHPLDGHIFNLGHGISQFTPPEHVSALVEAVHQHSLHLRAAG